jgi:hypothetical protein
MSDSFLSRWSRRKQEARRIDHQPESTTDNKSVAASELNESKARAPLVVEEGPPLTPEEIEQLPKIEELTVETDISVFLRKGVPDALRNAALRRMWSLDPTIRDFVGEARDYAYDWNTPGGVPGSGELLPGQDVQAMLRQVFGDSEPEGLEQDQSGVDASRVRDREELPIAELENPPASQQALPASGGEATPSGETGAEKCKADNILATVDQGPATAAPQPARPSPASDTAAAPRHGGAKPV